MAQFNLSTPQPREESSMIVKMFRNRLKVPFSESESPLTSWLWSSEAFSSDFLESKHDYIQWILPIGKPSQHNRHAPVLNSNDISAIRGDMSLLDNLFYAAALMLGFWGIEINFNDPERFICMVPSQLAAPYENLIRNPHNELRMTRLVQSLRAVGFYHMSKIALIAINAVLVGIAKTADTTNAFIRRTGFANKYLLEEYELEDSRSESERWSDAKFETRYLKEVSSTNHPASKYIAKVQDIWK